LLRPSKFENVTLFSRRKSSEGDAVLVTVAHLNWSVEEALKGFAYITLRYTASVIRNQWGERIKILKFWTCCETVKFTWDQSGWLVKVVEFLLRVL